MYPCPFCSQIHADGSGWADCFQACLVAYLRALGTFVGITDAAALNAVSLASRGTADSPGNPYTDLPQADKAMAAYGLPVNLSYSWLDALKAPFSICLVNGTRITLKDGTKPYPFSWFGEDELDHFVLWGPAFSGQYDWFMNPLDPARAWREYDLATVQASFGCAYILPAIPAIPAPGPARWASQRPAPFGLLPVPAHGTMAVDTVPVGGTGQTWHERKTVAGVVWERLQFRDRYGWAPIEYVKDAAA